MSTEVHGEKRNGAVMTGAFEKRAFNDMLFNALLLREFLFSVHLRVKFFSRESAVERIKIGARFLIHLLLKQK